MESHRYKVISKLGSGSFGHVYKVYDKKLGIEVALKRMRKVGTEFSREITILKEINHPKCIKMHDWFFSVQSTNAEQIIWQNIVVELMQTNLEEVVVTKEKRKLKLWEIKQIFQQISEALAYVHDLGITHRDVTPQNILLSRTPQQHWIAKLNDFGSAKRLLESEDNVTYVTARYYRAPELFVGENFYTSAVDVWSMGLNLFTMIFGACLIAGKDDEIHLENLLEISGTQTHLFSPFRFPKMEPLQWECLLPVELKPISELLSRMLVAEPSGRITFKEILRHKFLRSNDIETQ